MRHLLTIGTTGYASIFHSICPKKKSVKTDEEWKQIYLDEMSHTLKIIKCDLARETLFKGLSADQTPITVLPELQQTRILEAMVAALGGFISKESQRLKWIKAIKLAILLHHSLPKDLARVLYVFARQQFTYLKEAHWALICSQPLSADAMDPIPHHLSLLAVYCNDVSAIARLHNLKVDAHALNRAVTVAVDLGLYAALNQLLIHGFDVNQQSVLCKASERGHTNIVELLIEKGADVNQMCACTGATPLYIAALNGHADVVKMLIANMAVVDHKCTGGGLTPLYTAARNGHTEVVEVLLANQANVDIICTDYGYGGTALFMAAKKGRTKVVELLLANHADVNQMRSRDGATALYIAAAEGFTDIVELLIRAGANVNQTINGNYNCSPLYIAAINGHTKIVELLLANGADFNYGITETGFTTLDAAALSGHAEIIELLLAAQANCITPDGSGVTKEEGEEFRRGLFQRWQQKRRPGFFSSISTSAVIEPDENNSLSPLLATAG
jgi:ankyrin repeat protein